MNSGISAITTALGEWSTDPDQIPSPKRRAGLPADDWYGYYAGYPDAFVRGVLTTLPEGTGTVLDPWNGAGTTTAVATSHGIESFGFDLNPAAIMVAKAKLLRSDVASSIGPLATAILDAAQHGRTNLLDNDPLCKWFGPDSANWLRATERAIYRVLISSDNDNRAIDEPSSNVSSLAALFYLGLFRLVRPLLISFQGSNPTWIRVPDKSHRLRPRPSNLHARFVSAMEHLAGAVERAQNIYEDNCPTRVECADSRMMPLENGSVDAVISSPPYCTRIDYVVAMFPELAVLGMSDEEAKALRRQMIGTVLTGHEQQFDDSLTPAALELLSEVNKHESKAAGTYYAPFFRRYFQGMHKSLGEIARVTRPSGPIVLVAQDSHFKEHRVDLASIISEMGEKHDWIPITRADFRSPSNRAQMHPHRTSYRRSSEATETVLVFENGDLK